MDELLLKLLLSQLRVAGFFEDENLNIDEVKMKNRFNHLYDHWLEESISVLKRNEYIEENGRGFSITCKGRTEQKALWKEWDKQKEIWLDNNDLKVKTILVETTLKALPDIITGKIPATNVIFKDSSFELVEGIYKNNKVSDYFNEVLADTLIEYVRKRLEQEPSARIKIIEVGAGTGGTSAVIFSKLKHYKDNIEEYCYTDLSKELLIYAEENYGALNNCLTYKIFDIEKPIEKQDVLPGRYDVLIASNVLHTVKNIRKMLRNIKALLCKNGFIMINEISRNSLFNHLTFGLLEGWWMYEDSQIRIPGCPALFPEMWEKVLCMEGFESVFFPAHQSHDFGQQIVIAQSDGVVELREINKISSLNNCKRDLKQPSMESEACEELERLATSATSNITDQMIKDFIIEAIIEKLSSALKVKTDVIDMEESFADYGVDSIICVSFVQAINETLSIKLNNTDIFDYSSVAQLSKYILSKYRDEVAKKIEVNSGITCLVNKVTTDGNVAVKIVGKPVSGLDRELIASECSEETTIKKAQRSTFVNKEPIAVIGMSGRFGRANSVEELWEYLANGTDLVEEVSRWDLSEYYSGKFDKYCNYGSFIKDIDKFDSLFFNISGLEATYMDPQQRIFLEEAWRALEDAGYAGNEVSGRLCGVYVGCCEGDYNQLYGDNPPPQSLWGSFASVVASRISYFLNLHGPAIAVDTACSSSLVAVHLACQALWAGEIEMALAGGVFISTTPRYYMSAENAGMLSHSGHCFSFDNRADGMVPGEAAGAIILKRLKDAENDGDHIYGVIRGSGINQDGATNGITAPSANSQERLECNVYDTFNINPKYIQLIEAHGTGTKLGDPIEYQALTRAFRKYTDKNEYCAIGSIKSNVGHTQTAAGVTGIIKVLLALKYGQIPPQLHFKSGNSNIRFEGSPFYLNAALKNWDREHGKKRLAAVSSFGVSGTNAHVVIEEAPLIEKDYTRKPAYLFVLSAKSFEQLQKLAESILHYWRMELGLDLGNMSYTLFVGRKHLNHRLACVAHNINELVSYLESWLKGKDVPEVLVSSFNEKKNREQPELVELGNKYIRESVNINIESEYIELLYKIAGLYVKGCSLLYEDLFSKAQYSRISLPGYPFERKSFWVNESDNSKKTLSNTATLMYAPAWKESRAENTCGDYEQQLSILIEPDETFDTGMIKHTGNVRWVVLRAEHKSIEERFGYYTTRVFEEVKEILKNKPKGNVLIQIVVNGEGENKLFSGISGLIKSAQLENPRVVGQLIEVEEWRNTKEITDIVQENRMSIDKHLRYVGGKRYSMVWNKLDISNEKAYKPWKDGGVYLITGGTGGLGLIFAKEIAKNSKNATLILTGRSKPEHRQNVIKELDAYNVTIEYRQVDVTNEEAVLELIKNIIQDFGHLNGIIHCAGINLDNFIIKKTSDELLQVLAPKTSGLVYLDRASRNVTLDFFILFSSITGCFGNAGQADYAAANAFMDAYAQYRNKLVESKICTGLTLSINWPLWKNGGMHVDESKEKWLIENTGMVTIDTSIGIRAMHKAMASQNSQVAVIEGDAHKIQKYVSNFSSNQLSSNIDYKETTEVDKEKLRDKVIYKLKMMLDDIIRIGIDDINPQEDMESYGIDSIMINQLNAKLEEIFNDLSKTLFYEYSTISSLAEYLIENYCEACIRWSGMEPLSTSFKTTEKAAEESVEKTMEEITQENSKENNKLSTKVPMESGGESIAIVGISGRFPGAKNLKEFWENLKEGKDCVVEVPEDRWALDGFYCPDIDEAIEKSRSYSKWGGFLEGFADFDPLFFNITPKEAMFMDPQERLFIESCWEVLEDAGYTRESLKAQYSGRVGVFAGITKTGYELYGPDLWRQGEKMYPNTSFGSVANRVSYLFNFHGPSMPIDTMCSSSLTAIHEACEHIYRGECEVAIAGGVNLNLHPSTYKLLSGKQMLSVDGRCKSFGKGGNGYVPGEGACTVFLKRYSQALEDNDHIYALIRGTSINHGGKTSGYTVPSPIAQKELIRAALDKAGINARTISYIEAHGTGTELGDPIEITGLTQAFQKDTKDTGFSAIGSLKSNIGHLEAAAGAAGLIKVLLQMKYKMILPSLHSKELNPNINFEKTPFVVQQELSEWKQPTLTVEGKTINYPRRAGISSFGAGGVNAHIVVEEYGSGEQNNSCIEVTQQNPAIIILSGKDEERLRERVTQLLEVIREPEIRQSGLISVAYTLQVGREAMETRMGLTACTFEELEEKLKAFLNEHKSVFEIYKGQVKRDKGFLSVFDDEDMSKTIELWIDKRKYSKLLELWVNGFNFDWNKLHKECKPKRISLPVYPFARERYWIADGIEHKETNFFVEKSNEQHSDSYYEELIEEVANGIMSIDEAAEHIEGIHMDTGRRV